MKLSKLFLEVTSSMSNPEIDIAKLLQFLVDGGIVPIEALPSSDFVFNDEVLLECINAGTDLEYDSLTDELFVKTVDGGKIKAPDLSDGLSVSSEWLIEYLPNLTIDIDQGGNVRKGDEAESCYKLLCLGFVIPEYKDEIIQFFKNYDYEKMVPIGADMLGGFTKQVQEYQNINSVRVSSVFSAASIKISLYKEKNELFYTGQLDAKETLKLSILSREIKSLISHYERNSGLNPEEMKDMPKISKLQLIDKRDTEIEKLISSSEVGTLYRITKLTSERIPPVIKSKIYREADIASKKHSKEMGLSGSIAFDSENYIRRTFVREAFRSVLKSIKNDDILKYKSDPGSFKLKTKS